MAEDEQGLIALGIEAVSRLGNRKHASAVVPSTDREYCLAGPEFVTAGRELLAADDE